MDQSIKNDNLDIYNQVWKRDTQDYKWFSAGNIWYNERLKRLVSKHLSSPDIKIESIADIGCGDGTRTWILSKLLPIAKITGYDFSEAAILSARQHFKSEKVTFVQEPAEDFHGAFNMVSAFEVLEHVDDWQNCILQMIAGSPEYLLFAFPAGKMRRIDYLWGHIRNFRHGEVEHFLHSLGYITLEANYAGFPFYNPLYILIQGLFVNYVSESSTKSMSKRLKIFHKLMSYPLLYLSTKKNFGKSFMGLFQRV